MDTVADMAAASGTPEADRPQWILRCTQRLARLRPDIPTECLSFAVLALSMRRADLRRIEPETVDDEEAARWLEDAVA